MQAPNYAHDLEQAALLIDGTTESVPVVECQRLAGVLRRIIAALAQPQEVYASPAAETPDGVAYALSKGKPLHPNGESRTLYDSPVSQLQNDILIAWSGGEISEGRACQALGMERVRMRRLRMDAINRVWGQPELDPEGEKERARAALDTLNAKVEEMITEEDEPTYGDDEQFAIRNWWAGATGNEEFLQAFEAWRGMCLPAKASPA